ncbi:hypothetical protein GCM10007049_26400 [Echinicola pacifica]|uniref:Methyltransferase type 12 domain-containing protein n=1 Tax=Echinicola pacifica TaxID=346377 RepID=A0A918Q3K2_9BACT|nr:class I SAM-dependent methyltransferase [Echinicola pacifica]GGZ31774.1 hypothetical protein GCM10007049_26400 [Echinicola pacifica]
MEIDRKSHWEQIYQEKGPTEVSWYQEKPQTSLDFIHSAGLTKGDSIIDIGGGDSRLVDYLLQDEFSNLSVLDISANAIAKGKRRLGEDANAVSWLISDVLEVELSERYRYWHDRAVFHFLVADHHQRQYLNLARQMIVPGGRILIGAFSEQGPKKCSGIAIQQYSASSLCQRVEPFGFQKTRSKIVNHSTPFGTVQNFVFVEFERIESEGVN